MRDAIYPRDESSLRLRVHIFRISRAGENEKAVAAPQILPAAVCDSSGISRIADPFTIVLRAPENVVRIGIIHADVIKLRNWQILRLPPIVSPVVGIPNSSVIP